MPFNVLPHYLLHYVVLLWNFREGFLHCCNIFIDHGIWAICFISLCSKSILISLNFQIPNVVGFVLRVAQILLYIIYKYMKKSNETTMEQHEETTKGLQYVPTADHEPSGIELKVATCKSPHQVDYFNEHHPMFMERDEYLS